MNIGPQTTKEKGIFQIDLEDDAVQNMIISYEGKGRYPDAIVPFSPPPPPVQAAKDAVEKTPEELMADAT